MSFCAFPRVIRRRFVNEVIEERTEMELEVLDTQCVRPSVSRKAGGKICDRVKEL